MTTKWRTLLRNENSFFRTPGQDHNSLISILNIIDYFVSLLTLAGVFGTMHLKIMYLLLFQRFYRYHESLQERTLRVNPALAATNQNTNPVERKKPYGLIVRQSFMQLYNIFIVFFVTLAVFPTVHSGNFISQFVSLKYIIDSWHKIVDFPKSDKLLDTFTQRFVYINLWRWYCQPMS